MMKAPNLVTQAMRQAPELRELEERLEEGPDVVLSHLLPARGRERRGAARAFAAPPSADARESAAAAAADELVDAGERARAEFVDAARRAVTKIRRDGTDADLEPEEAFGLEAIVLPIGRPAILIQDGRFFPPPVGWEVLDQHRVAIETTFHSVGRIEVNGHPSLDWIGTGFLVAGDVVMTNRHVAKEFARRAARGRWTFEPGMTVRIDFAEELGSANPAEFAVTDVVGIHDTLDLALLRVERATATGAAAPQPLAITAQPPPAQPGRKVYVTGYPARDSRRNDPDIMERIFTSIYNVKRLQPGEITGTMDQESLFTHDCSTLGGNSGSCVVDLETNRVIGLHFSGRYLQANFAVELWKLTADPLIKRAKLNFI